MRGGNLKKKKLEGGWGGGRCASPPMHCLVDSHVLAGLVLLHLL